MTWNVMFVVYCRGGWRLWHSASMGRNGLGANGTSEWSVCGLAFRLQCYQELHVGFPHLLHLGLLGCVHISFIHQSEAH